MGKKRTENVRYTRKDVAPWLAQAYRNVLEKNVSEEDALRLALATIDTITAFASKCYVPGKKNSLYFHGIGSFEIVRTKPKGHFVAGLSEEEKMKRSKFKLRFRQSRRISDALNGEHQSQPPEGSRKLRPLNLPKPGEWGGAVQDFKPVDPVEVIGKF